MSYFSVVSIFRDERDVIYGLPTALIPVSVPLTLAMLLVFVLVFVAVITNYQKRSTFQQQKVISSSFL